MEKNIPKTPLDLNKAQKNAINISVLNTKETRAVWGKKVSRYQLNEHNSFILTSYSVTQRMIKDEKAFQSTLENPENFCPEKSAQRLIERDAKNELFGYRFARAFKMNIPQYCWLPDHKNKIYNIALSDIKGETPKEYLTNPNNKEHIKKMKKEAGYSIAVATLLGYSDINDGNFLIENHRPVFFDFDQALDCSAYWDLDPEKNQKGAINLLENFIHIVPQSDFSLRFLLDEITYESLLIDFEKAGENLTLAKNQFNSNYGKNIYNGLQDRKKACIDHLKFNL